MPWKETDIMNQRSEFVLRVLDKVEGFDELCREYGISRKTGYKWKERFLQFGMSGLNNASRRPKNSPKELGESIVCQIVKLKKAHPGWGARKLRVILGRKVGSGELPSESSFKRVLDKAGLVTHRRRRERSEQGSRLEMPVRAERPNQVWTIDFKGWWYTRNRYRFQPLTIRDDYSRYVLCAQAMNDACTKTVREQIIRVFERHGLPEVIRSDNGAPFASRGSPLGLSRLSAWWLALGINLDRIAPGRPDQNGGHERMHRDISEEVECNAEEDPVCQQAALDVWRRMFNEERPHEALGMQVPSEVYHVSSQKFDGTPIELVYPVGYLTRKISSNGVMRIENGRVGISKALSGWDVGLEPVAQSRYAVWFCRQCIGQVDMSTEQFEAVSDIEGSIKKPVSRVAKPV